MEKEMRVLLGKNRINAEYTASACRTFPYGNPEVLIESVCTDSREVEFGSLFCAIPGERVDGHDYIRSAYNNGCRAFLCERIPDGCEDMDNTAFIRVDNTVAALSALADAYCHGRVDSVIGVTGSVGKTTTKEFVASVLPKNNTYRTRGNYNSVIGLPLSMLEMPDSTSCAVLEMGMSGRGEIEIMSRVAKPDIAIITNIGTSHMEMLGSREGIRDAKLEIVKGIKKDGVLLVNGDDDMLRDIDVPCKLLRVSVKDPGCEIYANNIRQRNGETVFDVVYKNTVYTDIRIPTLGIHNVYAASFAFAVACLTDISFEDTRERLAGFETPKMRQNIYDACGITIIEDCYNASPESMRAALDVLDTLSRERGNSRKVALLGDMLELGESSPTLHRGVGEYVAERKIDRLVTLGALAKNIADGARGVISVSVADRQDSEEASERLAEILLPGDILLVKASRGVHAEKVIELIKERLK